MALAECSGLHLKHSIFKTSDFEALEVKYTDLDEL